MFRSSITSQVRWLMPVWNNLVDHTLFSCRQGGHHTGQSCWVTHQCWPRWQSERPLWGLECSWNQTAVCCLGACHSRFSCKQSQGLSPRLERWRCFCDGLESSGFCSSWVNLLAAKLARLQWYCQYLLPLPQWSIHVIHQNVKSLNDGAKRRFF